MIWLRFSSFILWVCFSRTGQTRRTLLFEPSRSTSDRYDDKLLRYDSRGDSERRIGAVLPTSPVYPRAAFAQFLLAFPQHGFVWRLPPRSFGVDSKALHRPHVHPEMGGKKKKKKKEDDDAGKDEIDQNIEATDSGTEEKDAATGEPVKKKKKKKKKVEKNPGKIEGTDLRVLEYPHPALRAPNEEVTKFDGDLKQTTKEMFMVMYASDGIGLAAPQVGINKRFMVFNPTGELEEPEAPAKKSGFGAKAKASPEIALYNPRIVKLADERVLGEEGCLSVPGIFDGKVERSTSVKVEYQDVDGKWQKATYTDREAVIFQHEYDHLDGKLYIDRLVDDEERERLKPAIDSLIEKYDGLEPAAL